MLESLTHTFLELPEMNYFYNLSARVIIYYLINPQIGKKKPDSVFLLPNMLDLVKYHLGQITFSPLSRAVP